jgi:hypothetical protein
VNLSPFAPLSTCALAIAGCSHAPTVVGVWRLNLPEIHSTYEGQQILTTAEQRALESESIEFKADGTLTKKMGAFHNTLTNREMPAQTETGTYIVSGNIIDLTINETNFADRQQWILREDGKALNAYTSWTDTSPTVWVRR